MILEAGSGVNSICPCGSQKTYLACCYPLHANQSIANTAEQLMRSRYSAYAKIGESYNTACVDYLINTQHSDDCSPTLKATLINGRNPQWTSLRIISTEKGSAEDNEGKVEFVAFSLANDQLRNDQDYEQMHECSSFIKEDSRWLYTTGQKKPPIKLSRNDLCWCGSGKKYKHCHQR